MRLNQKCRFCSSVQPIPPCTWVAVLAISRADLGDVREHVAGHLRRLVGQRVEAVRGVPEQRPRGLERRDHLRAHVLHGLERADRAPELLALLRVGDRLLDHRLARAERVGRERDPARVERARDRGARAVEHGLGRGAVEHHLGRAARGVDRREPRDR